MIKFALVLLFLPQVHAQLIAPEHNITYDLGYDDFFVTEVITLKNIGSIKGNLFRDSVYFTRGNAWDVNVEVIGEITRYELKERPTTIVVNLTFWKGENRKIRLEYKRSDMLYKGEVNVLSGLTLGKYPWVPRKVNLKFIAPREYQFGNMSVFSKKIQERGRETLVYQLKPIDPDSLKSIVEGFPLTLEYAKYREMAAHQIEKIEEFLPEVEFAIKEANTTLHNAIRYKADAREAIKLYNKSIGLLEKAKTELQLAALKNDPGMEDYHPYEAYFYASDSLSKAKEAWRTASEAENLANFAIQAFLEGEIARIGKDLEKMEEREDKAELPGTIVLGAIFLLAFLLLIGKYRKREIWTSKLEDFRVIKDLKRKKFAGFEEKVRRVKRGEEIAREILALKIEKRNLDSEIDNLAKKKMEKDYSAEKKKLEKKISVVTSKIHTLERELEELRKTKSNKRFL
jgi:hypothetical protein